MVFLYLTVELCHLSGKLDLCGVGQLGVQRGRSSSTRQLGAIIHLQDRRDVKETEPSSSLTAGTNQMVEMICWVFIIPVRTFWDIWMIG